MPPALTPKALNLLALNPPAQSANAEPVCAPAPKDGNMLWAVVLLKKQDYKDITRKSIPSKTLGDEMGKGKLGVQKSIKKKKEKSEVVNIAPAPCNLPDILPSYGTSKREERLRKKRRANREYNRLMRLRKKRDKEKGITSGSIDIIDLEVEEEAERENRLFNVENKSPLEDEFELQLAKQRDILWSLENYSSESDSSSEDLMGEWRHELVSSRFE